MLKIMHQTTPPSKGFNDDGTWYLAVGGHDSPSRAEQNAFNEWAKHTTEADRLNSQT